MLTETMPVNVFPNIPADIEEVEYPPEVVDRWNKQFEIAKLQYATGELQPMSVAEYAAQKGIKLNV